MSRCVPTPEEIFAKHELDKILCANLKYRDRPDLEYTDDKGIKHGIEVVEACNQLLKQYDNTGNAAVSDKFNGSDLAVDCLVSMDPQHGLFIGNDAFGKHNIIRAINSKSSKLKMGYYNTCDSVGLAVISYLYNGCINSYIDDIAQQVKDSIFDIIYIIAYVDSKVYELNHGSVIKHALDINNQNSDLQALVIKEYLDMESSKNRDRELRDYIAQFLKRDNIPRVVIDSIPLNIMDINSMLEKYTGIHDFLQ